MDHDAIRHVADAYTAAWNSGSPEAAGFFADIPDLSLVCDGVQIAGEDVLYRWTFTGTHVATQNAVRVSGWEEWDVTPDLNVASSRGWYDADDYTRQTGAE